MIRVLDLVLLLDFLTSPHVKVCGGISPYSQHVGDHAPEERMEGWIRAKGGGEQHSHRLGSEHAAVPLLPAVPRRLCQQHLHVRWSTHTCVQNTSTPTL